MTTRWESLVMSRRIAIPTLSALFLDTLSQMPEIGQDYDAIPEVKKIAFRFHTVYYVIRVDDILIARILHQLMEPRRHW